MLDYRTHVKHRSLYNTPPVFAIYVVGLVLEYLEAQGGCPPLRRPMPKKPGSSMPP